MRRKAGAPGARLAAGSIAAIAFAALAGCAPVAPAPVTYHGANAGSGGEAGRGITVRQNDTLYAISRRQGVSLRALIAANNLRPPYLIVPGQTLVLPRARLHTVAKGDTVFSISRRYDVNMSNLARVNRLGPPFTIAVGQQLVIPGPGPGSGDQVGAVAATASARANVPANARAAASRTTAVKSSPQAPKRQRVASKQPVPAPPPRSGKTFSWPVQGKIISGFGPKQGGYHNDGINIAASAGTPVFAAENGVVSYAGNELRGYGNLLLVQHAGGWITAYAHNQKLLVSRGDRIAKGQLIAHAGDTGGVRRPQLHFEIRKGATPVNPIKYLPSG